jgi:hypothetical protein
LQPETSCHSELRDGSTAVQEKGEEKVTCHAKATSLNRSPALTRGCATTAWCSMCHERVRRVLTPGVALGGCRESHHCIHEGQALIAQLGLQSQGLHHLAAQGRNLEIHLLAQHRLVVAASPPWDNFYGHRPCKRCGQAQCGVLVLTNCDGPVLYRSTSLLRFSARI